MINTAGFTQLFSAQSGTRIELTNLHKNFGEVSVLKGIDIEIRPGEFLAIVGRSGCGKSTLLRLIAGLEAPSSGAILLDDEPLRGLQSSTRIMFQEARLLPWQRVIDNVKIGLRPAASQQAEYALEQVGLTDRANDWPTILSGGQKQRVALARALVSQPRLMLLDEPLGALDALTRLEMQSLLESLWREQQFTALLVTHDVDEAVALADRIIILDNGVVVKEIAVPLERPRHRSQSAFGKLEEQVLDYLLAKPSSNSTLALTR